MAGNTFEIALVSIIIAGFIMTIIRRRAIDKCLKDYRNDMVTVEMPNGVEFTGIMKPDSSGIEIILSEPTEFKKTVLIYKKEIDMIPIIYRYHDMLTKEADLDRKRELRKTYHPNIFRRIKRKFLNMFKTFRDSFVELLNMIIGQFQANLPANNALVTQKGQIDKVKNEALANANTAFEPLLEKYIGCLVIVEYYKDKEAEEIKGVLKEYSNKFIEISDALYYGKKADLILPRTKAFVRHLAENVENVLL
ncbi:MAG: hypothetical protein JXQ23_06345 [Clostridia bacterium]|nr:hypothetical protein [Clostridia bacterium]